MHQKYFVLVNLWYLINVTCRQGDEIKVTVGPSSVLFAPSRRHAADCRRRKNGFPPFPPHSPLPLSIPQRKVWRRRRLCRAEPSLRHVQRKGGKVGENGKWVCVSVEVVVPSLPPLPHYDRRRDMFVRTVAHSTGGQKKDFFCPAAAVSLFPHLGLLVQSCAP